MLRLGANFTVAVIFAHGLLLEASAVDHQYANKYNENAFDNNDSDLIICSSEEEACFIFLQLLLAQEVVLWRTGTTSSAEGREKLGTSGWLFK